MTDIFLYDALRVGLGFKNVFGKVFHFNLTFLFSRGSIKVIKGPPLWLGGYGPSF